MITGPCKIKGQVSISASKNAALPILASTLLFDKSVVIENLPKVTQSKLSGSFYKTPSFSDFFRLFISKYKKLQFLS